MGLDFSKAGAGSAPQSGAVENVPEVVKQYDIVADRQQMNETLTGSQEVDDIVSTIEVNNLETIVSFGSRSGGGDFQSIGRGSEQHEYVPAG